MATKLTKNFHIITRRTTRWFNASSGEIVDTPYTYGQLKTDLRAVGANYPDWRERLKNNRDCTTYLHGYKYSTINHKRGYVDGIPGDSFITGNIGKYGDLESVFWVTSSPYMTALVSTADNRAKAQFVKKYNKLKNHFQGGVFLGELHEALRMIKNPARGLRKGLDSYKLAVERRARRTKTRTALDNTLADTWLEYSFGWAPLLNDVKDGAEALARLHGKVYSDSERISARAEEIQHVLGSVVTRSVGFGLRYRYRLKTSHEATVIYRAGVGTELTSNAEMARHLFGFRWEDFIPTVWELIPYSFLVDYFSNVGDVLSSWSHAPASLRWANKTVLKTIDNSIGDMYFDWDYLRDNSQYMSGAIFQRSSVTRRYRDVVRDVYDGDFLPSFMVDMPDFGLKWLNIAALADLRYLRSGPR
jgi:hypothetical protein